MTVFRAGQSARFGLSLLAISGCTSVRWISRAESDAPALVAEAKLTADGDSTYPDSLFGARAQIHGRTMLLAVDYGSNASILTDAAFDSLHLRHIHADAERGDTLVGPAAAAARKRSTANLIITRQDTTFEYWGHFPGRVLDSLRIGETLQQEFLIPQEWPAVLLAPFDGFVGRDFLSQFDLEFDGPARVVRVYARPAPPAGAGHVSWLPAGMAQSDCMAVPVRRVPFPDTAGIDESEKRELTSKSAKRLLDQLELEMPVMANGHSTHATFDSGIPEPVMNWAEAKMLGLDSSNANVRRFPEYGLADAYLATGMEMRIGRWRLAGERAVISDRKFDDEPGARRTPMLLLGWRQFGDRVLFLSHTAGAICLSDHR
jgi:hypothetical protein